MAKLPGIKLLQESEYQNPEIKRLVSPLNQHMTAVNNALNNGLTIRDNLAAQYNTTSIYISDASEPYPFAFSWRYPELKPLACEIVRIDSQDGVESVLSACMPRWTYSSGRILILGIRGNLTQDKWYDVTFRTTSE